MGNSVSGQSIHFPIREPDVALDVGYKNGLFALDVWYENGLLKSHSPYSSVKEYYDVPENDGRYWFKLAVWWYESYDAVRMSIWQNGKNVTENFQLGIHGSNLKLKGVTVNALALDLDGWENKTDFYFGINIGDREGLYWNINTMYSKNLLMGPNRPIDNQTARLVVWVTVEDFLRAVDTLGLNALEVLKSNDDKDRIEVIKGIFPLGRNKRVVPNPVFAGGVAGAVIAPEALFWPLTIAFTVVAAGVYIYKMIESAYNVEKPTKFIFGRCNYTTINCGSDLLNKLICGPKTFSGLSTYAQKAGIESDQAYHPILNSRGSIDVGFGTRDSCVVSPN